MKPTSVRVLARQYAIEWGTTPKNTCGICDNQKQLIKINGKAHHDLQQDTLLHEILHAIDEHMDSKMEEKRVNRLASLLLLVLKENPLVTEYLFK